MQGENARRLYYSKSPFGVEYAWELGAQSRKEAFLAHYTLLAEFDIKIPIMHCNKTGYENSLTFRSTKPLKSIFGENNVLQHLSANV